MDIDNEITRIIVKSISNDGILRLSLGKIPKLKYKTFSVGLGKKHVIKELLIV